MSESQIAIAVSVIALIGPAINVWLTYRIKVQLLEANQKLVDRIHQEYVPREVFTAEVRRIDERHNECRSES